MVTIQSRVESLSKSLVNRSFLGLFTVISPLRIPFYNWELLRTFLRLSSLYCEAVLQKTNSFMVVPSKTAKCRYFFTSHLFTFHCLVQLLLPTVQLNGVSEPISIEYKIVHG